MQDYLYHGRLNALNLGVTFGDCTQLINTLVVQHDCDPVAAHLLGRATTAAVLCEPMLKPGEQFKFRWQYEGVLKTILVDVASDAATRALISPPHLSETHDKNELYGSKGMVHVARVKEAQILSSGTTEGRFGDPVEDLAFYFSYSEQVESVFSVMIEFQANPEKPVRSCFGLLFQALPDADFAALETVRERLNEADFRSMFQQHAERQDGFDVLLDTLFLRKDVPHTIDAVDRPSFRCSCGPEKIPEIILMLPYADRMDMVQKKEDPVIHCEFCKQRYSVPIETCIEWWQQKKDQGE